MRRTSLFAPEGIRKTALRERAARGIAAVVALVLVLAAVALVCDIYKAAGGNGLQIDGSALQQLLASMRLGNR